MSCISPRQKAGKISKARYEKLVANIKKVLTNAIEKGGTTLRDFVNGDGKPGYFRQELRVYDRVGAPCIICKQTIKMIRQGQRSTYFCSNCQK